MKNAAAILFISFFFFNAAAQQKPEGLFINSKAPEFKAKDQHGNEISLKEMRKRGPVVLLFYRGYWCPFCSRHLKNVQDSLNLIQQTGASLVAITAEAKPAIDSTILKTGAAFPILFDEGMKIAKAYDVCFRVDERVVTRYRSSGVDLLKINQQRQAELPVPAVYIINKEGDIIFRYFDENYRQRLPVSAILQQLK